MIHSTAIVDPAATIHETAEIGPYCVVGAGVHLGAGTRLIGHVWLDGATTLGAGCTVYPHACVGTRSQDLKFRGGTPRVEIGDRTVIREYATVNAATADGDVTRVGADCLLMASSHVAHDCRVGDRVIIANCGTLGGHVVVEDQAIVGGLSGVHQFVRIGKLAIIGGCSKVTQDIPPYMMADGHPVRVHGLNRVGLERQGVPRTVQRHLKLAYRVLYRRNLATAAALEHLRTQVEPTPQVTAIIRFVEASTRGIAR
jgi:UDP-N-acetylglucosamine acyltransferase